ncbi:MAG: DUF169 domain-containing protein [Planctomycetota bacterium]|jgi:uncharacterized protein (DUF169 family)
MSTTLNSWYRRYLGAHDVPGLEIPVTAVKFYSDPGEVPPAVREHEIADLTLTSCQATKQASLGDAVCLTRGNIGCVAAAISLGLVDEHEDRPIQDSLVYTDIMREQSGKGDGFTPPTPKDFQQGTVYACAAANRSDFGLFGDDDSGRFQDVATARTAVKDMVALQPASMAAVFLYSPTFTAMDVIPDVVVLSVRPVELTRLIQGYWFVTGERVNASMGGLRMVNSDLIARPYITGEINTSPYCLGARLIAQFGPDRMGVGIPWGKFRTVVEGMEASRTGYPFHAYPGANPQA